MIAVIDKTIRASDLGINPVADSELVRLPIPALTQERRRDLAKTVGKQTEEARVAVRSARRDAMDMIKDAEKDKQITEDERKNGAGAHRKRSTSSQHSPRHNVPPDTGCNTRFRRDRERPRALGPKVRDCAVCVVRRDRRIPRPQPQRPKVRQASQGPTVGKTVRLPRWFPGHWTPHST
jgi:hypothetical protein